MYWDDGPEIDLADGDRDQLRQALAQVYHNEGRMNPLLDGIRFPRDRRPFWTNAADTWQEVFNEFDNGIMDRPWRRLVIAAFTAYQRNTVFRDVAQRYIAEPVQHTDTPEQPASPADTAQNPPPTFVDEVCHVVVHAVGDEADQIRERLDQLGLRPEPVWATEHGVSFRVNTADPMILRRRLQGAAFGYIVVEPGRPDYILHALMVNGPDGRRFRIAEAPAQQRVANIASEVLDQYPPFRETTRPTVVDLVGPAGQGDRLDPDDTLHDAGVQDGDELRVGFQATAGAVHPQHREEALYRVRNQIVAYAKAHEDFGVAVDWPQLPSEYTLQFRARSFAPDPDGGPEPVETDRPHRVLIEFGPDFPMAPPRVFWLTPIFHPNVYPMYECEAARNRPHARGLVCLGELAVSYQPSLDFGELCQTLVDIAGYRNYRLFEATGGIDAHGNPVIAGDFFDEAAAQWAWAHQDLIRAIGGQFVIRSEPETPGFRNAIEVIDK